MSGPFSANAYPRIYEKPIGNTTCNICLGTSAPLTEDHIPPRSCLKSARVELEPFEHGLRREKPKLQISQSGVRYKTICGSCNSFLGTAYDDELARFCKHAAGCLSPMAGSPPTWSICCKPDLVIRAVYGHLLAAVTDDAATRDDNVMRPIVQDASRPIGNVLRVFYWLHAHDVVKIPRGVAMPASRSGSKDIGVFSIIKFWPIGFLVTNLSGYEGLPCLNDRLARNAASDAEVRLDMLVRPSDWPERVDPGNFIVGGRSLEDALTARPYEARRKPKC